MICTACAAIGFFAAIGGFAIGFAICGLLVQRYIGHEDSET